MEEINKIQFFQLPYKVGRKNKRHVKDANNKLVCVFNTINGFDQIKAEKHAQIFINIMNDRLNINL